MRHRARITRLQRLLLKRESFPPFIVHVECEDGTIITHTIHMRFE